MPPLLAGVLVFVVSAAILILEIVAGRLLAPYVGVTLETYTGIIGTVLAGIALGNWAGGRLADRLPPRRLLGPLVLAGGLLAIVSPTLVALFGAGVRSVGPAAIVGLSAVGFFAPAAVLAAVTPTVVKLQLEDLSSTGTVVGRYSALSTAGAIVGTFVSGFLLVAALPSRLIVFAVSAALIVGGLVLSWVLPEGRGAIRGPALVVAVLVTLMAGAAPDQCDRESPYFCARVIEDPARDGGRTLILDTLRHGYVDLDDPTHLELRYVRIIGDVIDAAAEPGEAVDAVHLGGGSFTVPRYVASTRPGSTNVVLELDPGLVELAEEELGLDGSDGLDVRVGDARLTARSLPPDSADLVVGDAFGGLAVPWHLTTVEFVSTVAEVLRDDGLYVMNVIDHPPLGFARAEIATLGEVFENVAVIAPPAYLRGERGGNFIVVASDGPLGERALPDAASARERVDVLIGEDLERFIDGAEPLTDAHAPVDQLLTVRR